MNLKDPLVTEILKLYPVHQRFFYINHFEAFKLFVSWLTEEPVRDLICRTNNNDKLPWFCSGYELQELAIILNVSQGDLYLRLMELEEEKNERLP